MNTSAQYDPEYQARKLAQGRGYHSDPYLFDRLPNSRKPVLVVIVSMCLLTIILLVVGLVYPVPQFSQTGGLLSLALTRNGTALISGGEGIATITSTIHARREFVANSSLPGTFFGPQLNQRAKAEGAVRYTSHTEYWDDNCGCMATKTAVYFTTLRTTRTLRPTVTLPTNRPPASTPTGVSGSSADSDYDKSNNPDAGDFVGLWLGVMGGCLQRQSGVLVCTGSAFSPNFAEIYEQVELPQNITALLPNGTDGAPAGILMGIVSFGVGGGLYAASQFQSVIRYAPGQWVMQGTDSDPTMLDPRHQWVLAICAGITAVAVFSTVAAVITLRNAFNSIPEAVTAWDRSGLLEAKLQNGFKLLDASAVIGCLILMAGLALIAYDLFNPWWYKARAEKWVDPAVLSTARAARGQASQYGESVYGGSTVLGTPFAGTPGTPRY